MGTSTLYLDGTSGTQQFKSGGKTYYNLTLNNNGATTQLVDAMTLSGNFLRSAGILNFNSNNITVTGSFTVNSGASNTFSNLAGRTITAGSASLNGQSGNLLNLNTATTNHTWTVSGSLTANYADISYSIATNGGTANNSTNNGNNSNWTFLSAGSNRTWDGEGSDSKWSTAANWSGNAVPTANDTVIFNSTSVKACSLDVAASVCRIVFNSNYTGTFTFPGSPASGTITYQIWTGINGTAVTKPGLPG